jgi:VWFA-related protein
MIKPFLRLFAPALIVTIPLVSQTALGQQQDDVVRINTELVQTDVNVFDKRGHFVDGARPEDFELTIDGKPQKILFFERIATGTNREAKQIAAPQLANQTTRSSPTSDVLDRARTIFFFVDDTHLSTAGIVRARKTLTDFVNTRMQPNDQVAIVSSSGSIGFLQQLTDNKIVLTTAISRLTTRRDTEPNTGRTRISDYMANQIINNNDKALFAYLIESIKLEQQMGAGNRHGDHRTSSSYSADPYLRNRLRQVQGQSKLSAKATLASLQGLLDSTSNLAGRKLLFILSDGFLVNQQDTDLVSLLRGVTTSAAQTSTVIYSIDLRDTSSVSSIDASTNDAVDFTGRQAGLALSERTANRQPLETMADETGGRVLLNPNSLSEGILQALDETADYYLLAWRPESLDQRDGKQRLSVTLKNHPDWHLRVRRKFYSPAPNVNREEPAKKADQLKSALGSLYPQRQAPLQLTAGYVESQDKSQKSLRLSMQIEPRLFLTQLESEKHKAELDVLGAAVDDRGTISTFKHVLTITPSSLTAPPVVWHQQLTVPKGLYQVRVAVRERESGWTGSAMQWLVIPDEPAEKLHMSSLFIAARQAGENFSATPQPVKVSVDRMFGSNSILRYQTYVYVPATNSAEIDVHAEIRRNGTRVVSTPTSRVPNNIAPNQPGLPYWSEISLVGLSPGKYLLIVTAVDRKALSTASQQLTFTIE